MKIYTKNGDKGTSSLISGRINPKDDVIYEAIGSVDELNSFLGLLISDLSADFKYKDVLIIVQNQLFNIGSQLASDGIDLGIPKVEEADILKLEHYMDEMTLSLPKLTQFILPSGSVKVCYTHICRSVTRRAERAVVKAFGDQEMIFEKIYLNRLSDYFFVLARYLNHSNGENEVYWNKALKL